MAIYMFAAIYDRSECHQDLDACFTLTYIRCHNMIVASLIKILMLYTQNTHNATIPNPQERPIPFHMNPVTHSRRQPAEQLHAALVRLAGRVVVGLEGLEEAVHVRLTGPVPIAQHGRYPQTRRADGHVVRGTAHVNLWNYVRINSGPCITVE